MIKGPDIRFWSGALRRRTSRVPGSLFLTAALMALGACSQGDGGPAPSPTVASVAVTPSGVVFSSPGQTRLFEAEVRDSRGRLLQGTPVDWSSSNPQVLVLNSQGIATAVAAGQAEVIATAGGVTGRADATVNQPVACQTVLDLAPGQTQVFTTAASGCGIVIPGGSAGSRWRVALYRSSASLQSSDTASSVLEVIRVPSSAVSGSPQAAPPAPAAVDVSPLPSFMSGAPTLRRALDVDERTARSHMQIRLQEMRLLQQLGSEASPLPPTPAMRAMAAPGAPSPNRRTFIPYTGDCVSPANPRAAFLVAEDDRLAFYQDSIQRSTAPARAQDVQLILDYYRDHGKPVIDQYFGGVSDIDGNGRINVLLSPAVGTDVAAFVWSGDFFPRLGGGGCAASNEMELIYFNNSLVSALGGAQPDYQALSTLVHEVKHVSSLYKRVRYGTRVGLNNPYHAVWVEEGTAEIAAEVSSRRAWASRGGPAVGARLRRQDFQGVGFTPENWGVILRLARTINYLSSQPNSLTTNPDGAPDEHSFYGSSWLFHRFLGDAFGGANQPFADSTLFRMQNDSMTAPAPGAYSQLFMLGRPFETLLQDYVQALLLTGSGSASPPRDFATYRFGGTPQESVTEIFCNPNPLGIFPWPVTTTGTTGICGEGGRPETQSPASPFQSGTFRGSLGPSGVRIHEFVADGSSGLELRGDVARGGWLMVARLQ